MDYPIAAVPLAHLQYAMLTNAEQRLEMVARFGRRLQLFRLSSEFNSIFLLSCDTNAISSLRLIIQLQFDHCLVSFHSFALNFLSLSAQTV